MARVTVEDCLENVTDQFALVHLAALRYRQLHRGANRLVDNRNKDVVCALREIAEQKVRFREDVGATLLADKSKLVSQRLQQLVDSGVVEATDDSDTQGSAVDDGNAPTPLI
jgi:DNA-directed RNA polymerase subunit omega